MQKIKLAKILSALSYFLFLFTQTIQATEKPNILLFYLDDLGWQDTELHQVADSTPIPWKTPNMLALAKDGVSFTQGYSPAPTCSPSRVALMNGIHPAKSGKTHIIGGTPPKPTSATSPGIPPYLPGRMDYDDYTIAEALRDAGYSTGHVGKWHTAISHNASPLSSEQGFDYVETELGISARMSNVLQGFATTNSDDPYRLQTVLDSSYGEFAGLSARPIDNLTENGIAFMEQAVSEEKPFFLFLSHFLVHTPISTRDGNLLQYYSQKMGYDFDGTRTPNDTSDDLSNFVDLSTGRFKIPDGERGDGQRNPFYAAMCDSVDWYLGQVIDYLKSTDDPRNPGLKLYDTTYIFFSSDNGGMEGSINEHITDNAPLDKGKISIKEGGIRVPFVVKGPGIAPDWSSDKLVNGLDLYPTFLKIADAPGRELQNTQLDGINILPYLTGESADIYNEDGSVRDTMFWHFPNSALANMGSAIRKGDFKLIKHYPFQTYSLYRLANGIADIGETTNLINDPVYSQTASALIDELDTFLEETGAEEVYFNPNGTHGSLQNRDIVPDFISDSYDSETNLATTYFETSGKAQVVEAHLYYTLNGGEQYEEWFKLPMRLGNGSASVEVPYGTTHYVFSIIDENNYLRSNIELWGLTPLASELVNEFTAQTLSPQPVSENFTLWQREKFNTTQIATGQAAPDYDFDLDGIDNYKEFLLSTEPRNSHSNSQLQIRQDTNQYSLSFNYAKNYPMTRELEVSTDLANWSPAIEGQHISQTSNPPIDNKEGSITQVIDILDDSSGRPKLFYRLRVME